MSDHQVQEKVHAELSPSGASRWLRCPGSIALSEGIEDKGSVYADEGTAAHELLEWCLTESKDAEAYIGRVITVGERKFEVDMEMADHVNTAISYLGSYIDVEAGDELMAEQSLPIDHITGEAGARGTSDVVGITDNGKRLVIADLKYGKGVSVDAENNEQMQLYALGALHEFSVLYDFEYVTMVILQPRKNHVSDWTISVEELERFKDRCVAGADAVRMAEADLENNPPVNSFATSEWAGLWLSPGEKQCQFCKAKATCPALGNFVQEAVGADFANLAAPGQPDTLDPVILEWTTGDEDAIAAALKAVPLIEDWCKAVRAEAERRLLAGTPVSGFKLVRGKAGARQWSDKTEVEATLKAMRLRQDEMYSMSLISPTQAEKLLAKESPKRWTKLQPLIVQAQGGLSVAPESDKRPAVEIEPVADAFAEVADDLV